MSSVAVAGPSNTRIEFETLCVDVAQTTSPLSFVMRTLKIGDSSRTWALI